MLPVFLILCSVLALIVYQRWSAVSRFWADRGVPHDRHHPLLGSLTFLQKENIAIWMRRIYDAYNSPYVGVWLFWRPALVINSPEIGHRILVKDSDLFRNRLVGTGTGAADPIGGYNIFTLNDPDWTSIRKRLTPIFTSAKLKGLHHLFSSKSKELTQRIENDLKDGKQISIRSMYADYTTDVIGITAFGVNCDATLTGDSAIRSVTKEFMKYDFIRGVGWCCIFFFPEMVKVFRFHLFPKNAEDSLKQIYKKVVAQRGGYTHNIGKDNDLLDILRNIKHDVDVKGEEMNEDVMISQAAVLLQAGFDTTAVSLTYITYELAFHPEAQEKLYNEILAAKKHIGDKDLDSSHLRELVYLGCVIKEILRKYSPMGWLDRVSSTDYKVDENLTIPAGTTVYVNTIGMHYDPKFYPEPLEFRPERFLPENDPGNRPFMPFGDGPRICIGMRFAYHSLWHAISSVVLKYKFEPLPGSKRPSDCELEKRGLLLMPGEELYVNFIPRDTTI